MGRVADAIRDDLRNHTQNALKALILEIDKNLRRRPSSGGTPVDTGHARANWVPSVGAPFAAEVEDNSAHDAGLAAVLAYKLEDGAAWLSNNVLYILALNDGHSAQRPAGFVEACIDEAVQTIHERFAGKAVTISPSEYRSSVGGNIANNLASAYSPFGGDDD